jgi:hypothetical protein
VTTARYQGEGIRFERKEWTPPWPFTALLAAAGFAPSSRSHFRHWCAASVALLAEGHLQNGLDANVPFTGFPFSRFQTGRPPIQGVIHEQEYANTHRPPRSRLNWKISRSSSDLDS